jgi:3-hydroxybutyryl-CoA dehydrogenase
MQQRCKIGVVGAGVMGKAVAYRFAKFRFDVLLVESDSSVCARAARDIRNLFRHDLLVGRVKPPADVLDRIECSEAMQQLSECKFIVENITEDRIAKFSFYEQLAPILAPDAVIAVNTSTLPVGPFGRAAGAAARVLGVHFMNPVYLKDTVELVIGDETSAETTALAEEVLAAAQMSAITVRDRPGFVINRVFMVTVNEAIRCLGEGLADAADIDRLFSQCLGHTMGPLATADLIGLDTIKFSLDRLHEAYGDEKYQPAPLLHEMVRAGTYGCKSGRGIFNYEGNS